MYIDALIKKELLKSAGPSLLLEEKESNIVDAEKKLTGAPKETLRVLRMVQKLLHAELRTENSAQVRLLARLIGESSPEVSHTCTVFYCTLTCSLPIQHLAILNVYR